VLHQAVEAGARLAEPGEFTFRALTNGKLDLTQAEGVAATISATSEGQLRAATMLRHGRLGQWASNLVDELATLLALVEAGIDFVDQEDVVPIGPAALAEKILKLRETLDAMRSRCRSWGELEALPWVVLAGQPSAGKSTLFNALLGQARAVVHAQPGTTRDVLTEPMMWRDDRGHEVEVMLVDMPGANATDTTAEATNATSAQFPGELVVNVLDVTGDAKPMYDGLTVQTKIDLLERQSAASPGLRVSALTGEGLDALRRAIADHLSGRAVSVAGEAMALQPRHEAAIRDAGRHLSEACDLLAAQESHRAIDGVELVADCLRAALDDLGGLGGATSRDEVIGRVFATFCVGK